MSLDAILGTGFEKELKLIPCTEDGLFSVDQNSAESIWTPHDRKAAFVVLKGQILCRVHSLAGIPPITRCIRQTFSRLPRQC